MSPTATPVVLLKKMTENEIKNYKEFKAKKKFECKICLKVFKCKLRLNIHQLEEHGKLSGQNMEADNFVVRMVRLRSKTKK